MRRGNRVPDPVDPPDDWVDGSWTVDCVCGVNFDDGEEMVDCDECGVWVHTRCSRYVKSVKVFACDKCKTSKSKRDDDGGETEVAELLVDMPTKNKSLGRSGENVGFRRRIWTQVPRGERVHVQGVPGGDEGVLCGSGLSGIFGAGLWKASGHVPKKFGFQYKEFDCWDAGNESAGNGEGVGVMKDKGRIDGDSVSFGAGKRMPGGDGNKKKKGEKGEGLDVRNTQRTGMKKDKSSMKSYCGKRKKENFHDLKDASGKKKARAVHMEMDNGDKRSPPASRPVSTPSSDAKHSEFHEGKGLTVDRNVIPSGKPEKVTGNVPAEPSPKGCSINGVGVDESKNTLAISGQRSESKVVIDLDKLNHKEGCVNGSDRVRAEHLGKKKIIAAYVKDSQYDYGSNGNVSRSCSEQGEAQVDINNSVSVSYVQCLPCDKKLDSVGYGSLPQKLDDLEKRTVTADCQINNAAAPSEPFILRTDGQLVDSDNSPVVKESSLEFDKVKHTREPFGSCEARISSGQLTPDKMVVSLGKSSSASATTLLSRTKYSDSRKTFDAQNYDSRNQQNVVSENKSKKDNSVGGYFKDRERYEKSLKFAEELPKSFSSSVKTSNQSKNPSSSNTSKTLSESKEYVTFSTAKSSLLHNISSDPMSGESASSLLPESALYIGNTTTASGLIQRSETVNHLNCQPSSKADYTLQKHHSGAPNTPATISDEELALLLHHELNSSLRVPRVPRMRHAGSLPQLASPTGANMLMKQSPSSSAGKYHSPVFKRKGKSIAEEGSQDSQELQDESKNMKRSPSLPVQRTNDCATKREMDYGSAPGVQSANKSNPPATSKRNVSSRCKSAQNASDDDTGSDIRVTRRTLPGLLSEIITKPMTYKELCDAVLPHWPYLRKNNGERYAYSSHSQAVLDCLRSRSGWARLVDRGPKSNAGRKRKINAEAPSFESEDNDSNKKNTKGAADCQSVLESCQDQVPKGKRKMRKRRRRLALQERGVKNIVIKWAKEKEADDVSYDEDSSLSGSSGEEESMSSEDQTIQLDDGTSSAGGRSEVSASE